MTISPGDTFEWRRLRLPYLDDPYNTTLLNERAVEVPIAREWMQGNRAGGLVEVGNVLGHYGTTGHRVIDRYEEADGVEALDVFDLTGPLHAVLAISTLEHVRWDPPEERDPTGAIRAVEHLRDLLEPGGSMLVTVPLGQNPYLDGAILSGGLDADEEACMLHGPDGWTFTLERRWGPLRERSWPSVVWVGEWYT